MEIYFETKDMHSIHVKYNIERERDGAEGLANFDVPKNFLATCSRIQAAADSFVDLIDWPWWLRFVEFTRGRNENVHLCV